METKTWCAVLRKRGMENQSFTVHAQGFSRRLWLCLAAALLLVSASALTIAETSNRIVPRFQEFPDPEGTFANLHLAGPTDTTTTPLFQDFASNVISRSRRPLPTTNLPFLSAVMFDGRESSPASGTTKIIYSNYPSSLLNDLAHQSVDAAIIHAQGDGTRPTAEEQQRIVDFETKIFTAQTRDRRAGELNDDGAKGGPRAVAKQPFFITVNSSVNFLVPALEQPGGLLTPGDGQFSASIFNLYDKWAQLKDDEHAERADARLSIARGEQIFNTL